MFPEGTRRQKGIRKKHEARWRTGAARIALEADVPLVPAGIAGTERTVRVIHNATSLGGTHSALESRRRWEGERCPENLLRLAVGLEQADDLWADLEHALAAA